MISIILLIICFILFAVNIKLMYSNNFKISLVGMCGIVLNLFGIIYLITK